MKFLEDLTEKTIEFACKYKFHKDWYKWYINSWMFKKGSEYLYNWYQKREELICCFCHNPIYNRNFFVPHHLSPYDIKHLWDPERVKPAHPICHKKFHEENPNYVEWIEYSDILSQIGTICEICGKPTYTRWKTLCSKCWGSEHFGWGTKCENCGR